MDSGYVFDPLDPAHREIRLLHLLPGSWEEPLCCDLQVVCLDDYPDYQGLSYVWGAPGIVKTVRCCERSHQVSLMGEIFSRASEVYVWLGDSLSEKDIDDITPRVLDNGKEVDWLGETARDLSKWSALSEWESETLAAFEILHLLSLDGHWMEKPVFVADEAGIYHIAEDMRLAWEATLKLLRLSWWTRIWVVQELVLAKKATLVVGSVSAPWHLIEDFCRSYLEHLPPGACCHSSVTWKMSSDLWQDIVSLRLATWTFYMVKNEVLQAQQKQSSVAFLQLLWLLRYKQATDPRDKVYGLLGLLHGQRHTLLVPDYSISTADAFTRCTRALIDADNSLGALIGPRLHHPGLPTWVIDFLPQENSGSVLFFQNLSQRISSSAVFNACGTQELRVSSNLNNLCLWGFRFDTVRRTAMPWQSGLVAQTLEEWEHCAATAKVHRKSDYPDGRGWADVFWRTMIRDTMRKLERNGGGEVRRASPGDERAYLSFRRWLSGQPGTLDTDETSQAAISSFRKAFHIATQDQYLFTTHKGYLGLGDAPEADDEIWILDGGRVPFLLRPYPDDSDHAGCFSLVGDCYVHGIMDGEATRLPGESSTREVRLV
ncbi:hypothetical protein LTR56_027351 [Elasticomyces elasticus]|nr:hypothetical protein LTR56_027351 [Elasticomyces elasticus]KAK3615443.1 hypothetical protein LTR22_027434 [Elasticomyces elasticus]KAK4897271.1 hypothetical protein LTR49_028002 [Elasticomyces elasticus]KAK5736583.1 hypothetical protein LTS12_026146 [Elasticomyces elasticus]